SKPRGPKGRRRDPLARENEELRKENARLKRRLKQAETILEIQKNHPRANLTPVGPETYAAVNTAWLGRSGRRLFGDGDPEKKHGPGTAADLRVVTPTGDPV
ncbi:MAG: hypothetical protein ACREID_00465, partial [Planctomycetota bacterium]